MSLTSEDVSRFKSAVHEGYNLLQMQAELEAMKAANFERAIDGKPIENKSDDFYSFQNQVIEAQRNLY